MCAIHTRPLRSAVSLLDELCQEIPVDFLNGSVCSFDEVLDQLESFDGLYPQESGESALQQLQAELANAMPYDLEESELREYKDLAPRWHDWDTVKAVCAHVAVTTFDRICESAESGE